jgi:hypothetical protein
MRVSLPQHALQCSIIIAGIILYPWADSIHAKLKLCVVDLDEQKCDSAY